MTAKDLFYYSLAFVAAVYGIYLLFYITREQRYRVEVREHMALSREQMDLGREHMAKSERHDESLIALQRQMLAALHEVLAHLAPRDEAPRRDPGAGGPVDS